jgi:hypothetical protein
MIFPSPRMSPLVTISPWSLESLGSAAHAQTSNMTNAVSSAWPSANLALFFPFYITHRITVQQLFMLNGATAAGNVDMGLYTLDGTRIISVGSTAQSGTNAIQAFSITSTQLSAGTYYLAVAASSVSTTIFSRTVFNSSYSSTFGMAQMTSAFPLPATATLATIGNGMFCVALTTRTFV